MPPLECRCVCVDFSDGVFVVSLELRIINHLTMNGRMEAEDFSALRETHMWIPTGCDMGLFVRVSRSRAGPESSLPTRTATVGFEVRLGKSFVELADYGCPYSL